MPHLIAAVVLVAVANLAPWVAGVLLGDRWAGPLDFGRTLNDGSRLLGSHKSWRGLLTGAVACALVAPLMGYPLLLGLRFGVLSLVGDAASSFVKRRLHRAPGTEIAGLDQLPEALLPLLTLRRSLSLSLLQVLSAAAAFTVLHLALQAVRIAVESGRARVRRRAAERRRVTGQPGAD